MTYKSARLTVEELHEGKHLMGGALTLLSFWSLLSLEVQSGWLITVAMLTMLFALLRPRSISRIPRFTWRLTGPLLLIIIGVDFLLHVPDFIPSLVRMIVWILLYRNLAPRRQREDLQLILLCLFCLVLSGVMTVSLLFAFQILLFTPMAMALLFVISLLDRGEQTQQHQLSWARFSWGRLIRRVWSVIDWRVLFLGTILFGFVVIVSTLLFVLTPRFDLDQAIPFMRMETQPMTGFSEEVSLGDVSSVQNDDSVAIRIDVPGREALDSSPFWRMLVLDRYAGGRFSVSDSLEGHQFKESMSARELDLQVVSGDSRRGDLWTFYMEGGVSRYLPVPGDYGILRFQKKQEIELFSEPRMYRLDMVEQRVFSYQIEDLQFSHSFPAGQREWQELKAAKPSGKLAVANYPQTTLELALSADERSSLAEINASLLAGRSLSAAAYSEKLSHLLWQRFDYSLNPDGQVRSPSAGGAPDPVINWLREGSQGHCELFAGAFVLLARDAGFPARLVVGFAGGSWNSVEDYFVIRNRNAHAWVEILDRESQQWLRVNPTPGSGTSATGAGVAGSLRFDTGWGAWVDSLRIQWYRRIVNFEQQDQIELAVSLKELAKAFSAQFGERIKAAVAEVKAWISQPFSAGNLIRGIMLLCLLVTLYLIWCGRYLIMGLVFRLLQRPKALDPVRRQASRYLQRLRQIHGQQARLPVMAELQALRFGPEADSGQAKPVFTRARKAMRRNEAGTKARPRK